MFENIRKDPMYRRLFRWVERSLIIFLYVSAIEIFFEGVDLLLKLIILFPITLGATALWTLIDYGSSKTRCSICQKTIDELDQPTNPTERNTIRDYCMTHVQLCDECLVNSYYSAFGIENRIKEIERAGLTQFYKDLKDEHTDFSKIKPKKI